MKLRQKRYIYEIIFKSKQGEVTRAEFGPCLNPPKRLSVNEDGVIRIGVFSHWFKVIDTDRYYAVYNEEERAQVADDSVQDAL
jgi:hypothetical protein